MASFEFNFCRHNEPAIEYTTPFESGAHATLLGPLVSCGKYISR